MATDGRALLRDDPVSGTEGSPDRLDRGTFADHLVIVLERVRGQSESSVLAMIGPWGSGKSSLLEMTTQRLRTAPGPGWLIADFNPWSYGDNDSLQAGFFAELRAAMPKGKQWDETRRSIGELGRAVSPFGRLGALVGVDGEPLVEGLARLLAGDVSATATKKKAEQALRGLARPILMVLDDLDRLTPQELLLVLKLVRLVGRLPHVYYLLSFDERTLLDVLMQTDLIKGGDEPRARDYLEKIVQVRVDLPALRPPQALRLVNEALDDVVARHGIELGPEAQARLGRVYNEALAQRLSTPRTINRVLAQVDAFYGPLGKEVDFVDFLCITWLRTAEPGAYAMVQRHRDELTGTSLRAALAKQPPADALAAWRSRTEKAGVREDHIEGVLNVLAELFLPIRAALDDTAGDGLGKESLVRRRAVGHADYFDRYFSFGVPEEDLADSVVADALAELADDEDGPGACRLEAELARDPARLVRKMRARRDEGGVPAAPLLRLLVRSYAGVDEGSALISNARFAVQVLAAELCQDLGPAGAADVIAGAEPDWDGLSLLSDAVRKLQRHAAVETDGTQAAAGWRPPADALRGLLQPRVAAISDMPADQAPPQAVGAWRRWRALAQEEADAWLRGQVDRDRWDLLDALALLVPTCTVSGGEPPRAALGDLDTDEANAVFGAGRLAEELAHAVRDAVYVNPWGLAPTLANRRACVLSALRRASEAGSEASNDDQEE